MIPTLLLPAGLVALAALALPLLLHLVRREEQRPVDFAALRWLSSRVRPRRRLRFEDWLLLALRLLLITLLALLLARPVLPLSGAGAAWIVAVPGVGVDALGDAAPPSPAGGADGATGSDPVVQRRWLADGFPRPGEAAQVGNPGAAISLLRELDMRMPAGAPLVVLVPPVLEGVDAERPRLSRPVEWRIVSTGNAPTADAVPAPVPRIVVRDAGDGAGARYLRAASAAWRAPAAAPGDGVAEGGRLEVHAWLAPGELPSEALAWIEGGGTALLAHDVRLPGLGDAPSLWSDDQGSPLLRGTGVGAGRALQWTRPLEPAALPALLDADFPLRVRAALQPPQAPARVLAAEHAPRVGGVGPWPPALRELSPWLALAIALVFLLERWIASAARVERQP